MILPPQNGHPVTKCGVEIWASFVLQISVLYALRAHVLHLQAKCTDEYFSLPLYHALFANIENR